MSEKIDYLKVDREYLGWALIEMMTAAAKDDGGDITRLFIEGREQRQQIEVEAKINGVEVSFVELIDRIEKQMDYMVVKKAKELLKENTSDLYEKVGQITQQLDGVIDDFVLKAKELIGDKNEE